MTLTARISSQVQSWRDMGQHEHAEWLRRQMWQLLGEFMAQPRGQ